ncbi:MAG: iron hydrogenase [bacterium]|nr:iron hydrogenase [bacterium]
MPPQAAKVIRIVLVNRLTVFATLLAVATVAPVLGAHQQWLTGPVVNATLYLTVIFSGSSDALLVGMIPSTIALSVGLLPTVLAPMIPFIILGNSLMVLTFDKLRRTNFLAAVVIASFIKFAFLFSLGNVVTRLILKKEVALSATRMLSWPQFSTAIAGGLIAYALSNLGCLKPRQNNV